MKRVICSVPVVMLLLCACSNGEQATPSAGGDSYKDDASLSRTSKVQGPIEIEYRVIGVPIVGQAVALDLQFKSTLGTQPYQVSYRVNDPTAMQLQESQPESVSIVPDGRDEHSAQQVRIIPLREGRLYLNVAAIVETDGGPMQTVIAIPIQVGPAASRLNDETGNIETDADGNLIRTTPAKED